MRTERIVLVLALVAVVAITGCPMDASITVYLDEDCRPEDSAGNHLNPLNLTPGDEVIWVNNTGDKVELLFDSAELFGRSTREVRQLVLGLGHELLALALIAFGFENLLRLLGTVERLLDLFALRLEDGFDLPPDFLRQSVESAVAGLLRLLDVLVVVLVVDLLLLLLRGGFRSLRFGIGVAVLRLGLGGRISGERYEAADGVLHAGLVFECV